MVTTQLAAVLFDWDLTLARALGDVTESERLASLFRSQGLDFAPEEIEAAMLKGQNRSGKGALSRSGKPQRRRDIIHSYFQILTHLGVSERDWAFGNRLYDAHSYLPTFLYDESLPMLLSLQQRELSLGIISNHARSARAMMESFVGRYIPTSHIVISQEVGVHKPAKTIFRHAARRVGVAPARCMFVGDNLTVDAIGAVEQGGFGRGLWLDREGSGVDLALPDRVSRITSLDQVLAHI
jgi:putative hydrolase of the HAD superfamily